MTQSLRSSGSKADQIARRRLARYDRKAGKPGLGTLAAMNLTGPLMGAGKESSGVIVIHLSPSAQKRQARIQENLAARAEYIRLGIIKPVVVS